MAGLGTACTIVSIILGLLAAVPQLPHTGSLLALSVAFLGLGHLL